MTGFGLAGRSAGWMPEAILQKGDERGLMVLRKPMMGENEGKGELQGKQ